MKQSKSDLSTHTKVKDFNRIYIFLFLSECDSIKNYNYLSKE